MHIKKLGFVKSAGARLLTMMKKMNRFFRLVSLNMDSIVIKILVAAVILVIDMLIVSWIATL